MRITFVTAGPIEWASSRLRAFWVADELKKRGHTVTVHQFNSATVPDNQDVYIWQKLVDFEAIERNRDASHYWDVCDPMWWFDPEYAKAASEAVDRIIFSSEALMKDFAQWASWKGGLFFIPDRLNLDHYPIQRKHKQTAVTHFIWFGIAANRQALYSALANLERLKANGHSIALTILDDRPDAQFTGVSFPVYHARWTLDTENEVIASHDVALLPPYPGPWGKVKSNNKTLTAWACGLPVITSDEYEFYVELASSHLNRIDDAAVGMTEVCFETIDKSADDWEQILNE